MIKVGSWEYNKKITKIPNIKINCNCCKSPYNLLKNYKKEQVLVYLGEEMSKNNNFLSLRSSYERNIYELAEKIIIYCPKCGYKQDFAVLELIPKQIIKGKWEEIGNY